MRFERWVGGLLICVGLNACTLERTVLRDSASSTYWRAADELDFWDDLALRPVTTNSDALHGLLGLAGEEASTEAYDLRLAAARERGWISTDDELLRNESATVGMIAVAVCDILGVQGGLSMRVLGPSPRYCTKELVFRELIPPRTENQSLSGLEFIDLVSRMEDELRRQSAGAAEPREETES
ncbi:MAG: hypothetical protein HKO59_07870 [Phycisphaerales bacterium]|nr:hypothetical protein [Phycisphaerales bacterium]NNM25890.1 hypothetical protein [Phycisphaerales bacterium]